jgi:hypothetical protein
VALPEVSFATSTEPAEPLFEEWAEVVVDPESVDGCVPFPLGSVPVEVPTWPEPSSGTSNAPSLPLVPTTMGIDVTWPEAPEGSEDEPAPCAPSAPAPKPTANAPGPAGAVAEQACCPVRTMAWPFAPTTSQNALPGVGSVGFTGNCRNTVPPLSDDDGATPEVSAGEPITESSGAEITTSLGVPSDDCDSGAVTAGRVPRKPPGSTPLDPVAPEDPVATEDPVAPDALELPVEGAVEAVEEPFVAVSELGAWPEDSGGDVETGAVLGLRCSVDPDVPLRCVPLAPVAAGGEIVTLPTPADEEPLGVPPLAPDLQFFPRKPSRHPLLPEEPAVLVDADEDE